tara:strand:+ start:460 stop:753 length:294 start_codon:yes stop_codon:yes gene_type:complete
MAKLNEMIREFRESINQSVEALAMLLQLYQKSTTNWKKTGTHLIQSSKEFAPSSSGITKTSNGFPYKDLSMRTPNQRKQMMLIQDNHHLHLYLLPKS